MGGGSRNASGSCDITHNSAAGGKKEVHEVRLSLAAGTVESATANASLLDEDNRNITLLFAGLLATELFINYDSGAVPASLRAIADEFHLEPMQQGFLGGLTYIGLTMTSPFGGYFMQRYSATQLLRVALFCNAIFTFVFAMSSGSTMLLVSRTCIGASQSAVASYAPVWVDEYAPKGKQTLWMSALQGSAIVGVMVGYSVAGFTQNAGWSWKFSIIIQACMLMVLALILACVPKKLIDLPDQVTRSASTTNLRTLSGKGSPRKGGGSSPRAPTFGAIAEHSSSQTPNAQCPEMYLSYEEQEKRRSEGEEGACMGSMGDPLRPAAPSMDSTMTGLSVTSSIRPRLDSLWQYTEEGGATNASKISLSKQLQLLWRSRIYVYTTLALAALFFVVTGIQFWITSYLTITLDASFGLVLGSFTAISATAPVSGLIMGGWIVDHQGGYHGNAGRAQTAQLCTYFGLAAAFFSIILLFVTSITGTLACVWFVLFWGGAMIPGSTGLLLSSVPQSLRAFSAAMSMFVYNICGYGAGGILPGIIMQFAKELGCDVKGTMRIGMNVVFLWSIFGVLWMWLASIMAGKEVEACHKRSTEIHAREERRKSQVLASLRKQRGGECAPKEGEDGWQMGGEEIQASASAPFSKSLSRVARPVIRVARHLGVDVGGTRKREKQAESIDRVFDEEIEAWNTPSSPEGAVAIGIHGFDATGVEVKEGEVVVNEMLYESSRGGSQSISPVACL